MVLKRLKVIGIWGLLLFLVTNGSAIILVAILGEITGALLTILIGTVFAGFAGYKVASALAGSPGYEKKNALVFVGVTVAFLAALLSGILNYLVTGQINFSSGAFTMLAAAIGGYIAERKAGSTTSFAVVIPTKSEGRMEGSLSTELGLR